MLAAEILAKGATECAESGVFLMFKESIDELVENMRSLAFDLEQLQRQKKRMPDCVRVERSENRVAASTLRQRPTAAPLKPEWQLRLYVAGSTPRSNAALDNLKRLCAAHLAGRYSIEVVDLLVSPQLAAGEQILAVRNLVRTFPETIRKIIGDLSNETCRTRNACSSGWT